MILVTGGAFQGKRSFAIKEFDLHDDRIADGATCRAEEVYAAAAVDRFHLLIRRLMESGEDAASFAASLPDACPDLIVITDEVGCGVVPVDPFEREYRDAAGRASRIIAEASEDVYRVYCGIAKKIKDGGGL